MLLNFCVAETTNPSARLGCITRLVSATKSNFSYVPEFGYTTKTKKCWDRSPVNQDKNFWGVHPNFCL